MRTQLQKNRLVTAIIVGTILLLSVYIVASKTDTQHAAALDCTTNSGFIAQPAQNEILSGTRLIEFNGTNDVKSVRFMLNGKSIGKGFRDPATTGYTWRMGWDTRYFADSASTSTGQLRAELTLTSNVVCLSPQQLSVTIQNSQPLTLEAQLQPPQFSGFTSSSILFELLFPTTSGGTEIARYADVTWDLNGPGSLIPQPYAKAKYTTGSSTGNGRVRAIIRYGGQEIVREAPLEIASFYNEDTSTSTGTDSSGGDNTQQQTQTTTTTTTSSGEQITAVLEPKDAITRVLQQDTVTETCIENLLGKEAVSKLIEENRRPRSEEFAKILTCFARQNFVIPNIFAPVAPETVSAIAESSNVRLKSLFNKKISGGDNGGEQTVLVLEGTARANSQILLYVFSEPLVLATTSDGDGNWSYSLEDPLDSGEHEVYALVDRGDGEYERSNVASFVVGQAEATDENPNGYSLQLITEPTIAANNRSVNLFVAATIGLVTFVATILVAFVVMKVRKHATPMQTAEGVQMGAYTTPSDDAHQITQPAATGEARDDEQSTI